MTTGALEVFKKTVSGCCVGYNLVDRNNFFLQVICYIFVMINIVRLFCHCGQHHIYDDLFSFRIHTCLHLGTGTHHCILAPTCFNMSGHAGGIKSIIICSHT